MRAMKHTLSILVLTSCAAVVSAQRASVQVSKNASYNVSVEANYGSVATDTNDYSGYGIAGRLHLTENYFVVVSRNDVTVDVTDLSEHQFAYGIGTSERYGQGTLSAIYARGKVSGDSLSVEQNIFTLAYDIRIAASVNLGIAVAHTLNAGDVKDVTATVFSGGYEITQGLTINATYAAEDTMLGQAGAKSTWTLGAKYSF